MAHTSLFQQFIRTLQIAHRKNLEAEGKPLPLTREQAKWKRRRLIKSALLAGGAALSTGPLSYLEKALGQSNFRGNARIAIIGGGIAGLNAAYQLKKAGLNAIVYEGKQRLGGRIRSAVGPVGEGLVVDLGGSFINSDHEDMLGLIQEFGLNTFNQIQDARRFPFPETGYFFDGRFRPEEEVADKLRPLALQIARDSEQLDQDFERFAPILDRLSVAQYLDKHTHLIPETFIRVLVENSIRTEFGVEPEESSALQLIFNLPTVDGQQVEVLGSSDEAFVVEGGSGKIIESLVKALSGQIQTRMHLTKLQVRNYTFDLTFNDNQSIDADFVIIAIPFTVLRNVQLEVRLPGRLRQFIQKANLGLNEKVFVGFTAVSGLVSHRKAPGSNLASWQIVWLIQAAIAVIKRSGGRTMALSQKPGQILAFLKCGMQPNDKQIVRMVH